MSPSRTGSRETEEPTGGLGPLRPFSKISRHRSLCEGHTMSVWKMTRRTFLSLSTMLGVMTLLGCPLPNGRSVVVYRRSGRGRHVSNAAKKHNANRLYTTEQVALLDLPHPGDHSKVVMVTISYAMYLRLFPGDKHVADLRRDL
jgi:hypothetical protein